MIRSRRANAGNRLQSLLSEQIPLDEADAEYFAEKEDDEDFDLEAEEARLRAERAARAAHSDAASNSSGDESESAFDDENFSDSSDDELENDEEPADAGEKELISEQRRSRKEQRKAEREKMFKIKVRPSEPKPTNTQSSRAKAPRLTAEELQERLQQRTKGRHAERQSALRNKQFLLEQIREAEERRAQYVPPKRKKQRRLTQAERLEEAKKTEQRNLSSLSKFVELEEERRIQQRLAMLSRRPKLTHIVRFTSFSVLEPPKPIDLKEVKDEVGEGEDKPEATDAKAEAADAKPEATEAKPEAKEAKPEATEANETNNEAKEAKPEEANTGNVNVPEKIEVKEEIGNEAVENAKTTKTNEGMETEAVEGPPLLRAYNRLTLHHFDSPMNKYTVRSTVLGPVAQQHRTVPPKRMCPFSGKVAKYIDPRSGCAYADLATYRMIAQSQTGAFEWSKHLGGVFTKGVKPPRHASGVPPGFA